ncbi:MAG TPA: zf-HC2 domain-containing protein [Bacteroidales bacterium]|nr:zf-HC2 domain-containing protein [Bacteroidales bacterium]
MKCEDAEILLVDYLDNSLDERTKAEVENHLSTCERCLDTFNESQKIVRIMSESVPLKPDDSLRTNFYHMLHKEIRKEGDHHMIRHELRPGDRFQRKIFFAAAGFALLVAGTFLGMLFSTLRNDSLSTTKIEKLQAQVDEIRRNAMYTMLKEESSSYRLQGVSYAEELGQRDNKVIGVLLNILNHDKSTNVRLAAAFSLSKFTDNREVCDSLVASLPIQTEPILQITLINILVEIKEKSALRPIRQLVNDSRTIDEVRNVAEKGAKELAL